MHRRCAQGTGSRFSLLDVLDARLMGKPYLLRADTILLRSCRPRLDARILDVGCGQGDLVAMLRGLGSSRSSAAICDYRSRLYVDYATTHASIGGAQVRALRGCSRRVARRRRLLASLTKRLLERRSTVPRTNG
jgi:2-polyprenyl-3-methyl-5-hydroxy-6-metoxy-1,4-benzoquinol methylase